MPIYQQSDRGENFVDLPWNLHCHKLCYPLFQDTTADNQYQEDIRRLQNIFKKTPKHVIEELLKCHGFDQTMDILLNEAQASPSNSSDEVSILHDSSQCANLC